MKTAYDVYQYDEIRNLNIKLFTPDDGIVERYVIALHGFAGSMESCAISALAEHLTQHSTAVLTFNYAGHGNDTQDSLFSVECCKNDFRSMTQYAKNTYPAAQWTGVFATSFGGFLTLNLLNEIPDSVRIVLRAPAVNMPEVFARIVNSEGGGMSEYRQSGSVTLGYDHKLSVPYAFYQDLLENDVFRQDFDREMLLIHGDCDDVVLPIDTRAFCSRNPKIIRKEIAGADHRFLESLGQVMKISVPWLLK